ncbi:MAG: glucose-1-phosphate adenylyltransferase [Armatimonadetes bacterium]|nr:glucose-1-phosphate adenylyltransferase [Armatimonadota bacterium]
MKEVLCVILGGGRGVRLHPLTQDRAKPAVPLGGKYRLVDVPMSNCLHSGLNKIYVLTQFNSNSLNRHISRTYNFDMFSNGFVEILAAQQTPDDLNWYQGTADAVRQNLKTFDKPDIEYVLILSGDQLYRMDFHVLIRQHIRTKAEVTLSAIPVGPEDASRYGVLKTDSEGRIVAFCEKPKDPAVLDDFIAPESVLKGTNHHIPRPAYLASMGIYIFNKNALSEVLQADKSETDFGKEIIPEAIQSRRVHSFLFNGYWEDIGTIRAYYEASMGFLGESPQFDFYSRRLYTHSRYLPASQAHDCALYHSLLTEGCIIRKARIHRSIIGLRSMIGSGCDIRESILMGADYYEGEGYQEPTFPEAPPLGIGRNCRIERAIIDKNARIGENVVIERFPDGYEFDGVRYAIREGIVVIPRAGVIPSGTVVSPESLKK